MQPSRGRQVPLGQSAQRRPSFKAGVDKYVNVVVRDGSSSIVRNLKKEDFTLVEDDESSTITAFDFEEVPSEAIPATEPVAPVQPILKAATAVTPRGTGVPGCRGCGSSEGGADRPGRTGG